MIKQLLNSVIAKYRDMSMSRRLIICLGLRLIIITIDLLAIDKSRYFAQPCPIIVNYGMVETQSTNYMHMSFFSLLNPSPALRTSHSRITTCLVFLFASHHSTRSLVKILLTPAYLGPKELNYGLQITLLQNVVKKRSKRSKCNG